MKKFLINISLILIVIVIYFLQSNFFSWFTIAGVKPNLFIVFVLFIGLFGNRSLGTIYGGLIGIFLDLLMEEKIGANLIGLVIIGILAVIFDKNFSKDSRMTLIFMVFGSTIVFEVISYLTKYILYSMNVEIFNFIIILLIEVLYNIILTIILYPLIQRFGYYIENEYKGNKILTRYF